MPVDLPPEVLQGLGIPLPVQFPPASPPLPPPSPMGSPLTAGNPAFGATEPAVPQFAPEAPPPSAPSPGGAAPSPARSSAPARPMPPDAQLVRAQQKQSEADVAQVGAIADETAAQRGQAASEVAAYKQFDEQNADLRKRQAELAADTAKIHATKQAYVDSTLRDVDSYKVDANKYTKQMGLGGMAGWGIAMVLSGIGDALQHKQGPNAVVQMLQDKIHQNVQLQLDERDQLKEKNARATHDLDKYDAWSRDRMAQMNLLEAQYEKRLGILIQEAAVKAKDPLAVANGQKAAADVLKSSADKAQKAAEFASTNDIAKRQLQVSQGSLGVSQFSAQETQRHNLATEGLTGEEHLIQANKELRTQADKTKQHAVLAPTTDGKVGLLTNKDGATADFRSPEIAQKNSDMVAAAQTYNKLVGQMKSALEEHGGSSATIKGKDWQRMQSDLQSAVAELHDAYGITAFREPTMEFFEKMASAGVDPNSFVRDASAALEQSSQNLQGKVNNRLHAAGYDGPDVAFPPTSIPKAAPSPIEQLSVSLKAKPDENPVRAYDKAFLAAYKANGGDIAGARVDANLAASSAKSGAVSPDQRQGIETLKAQVLGGDAASAAALEDVAKNASSSTVRRLAKGALNEIRNAQAPAPTTSSAGPTYDPNGYDPQALINRFSKPYQP